MLFTQDYSSSETKTTMSATKEKTGELAEPGRKAGRILYVDDLPGLREVTRIALASDGHTIECAADAPQAMARLAELPFGFDLVITDHCMAGLSGLQLVEWLRALAYPGKILVLTAESNPVISDAYRRLRVDRIVYKPTWPSELRQIVNELMA
jgi:CheY-like chemotaxis protein